MRLHYTRNFWLRNKSVLFNAPLLFLLIPLIVFNFFEFATIESRAITRYKALYSSDNSNVLEAGLSSPEIRQDLLPWLALNELAPNSVLYINSPANFPVMDAGNKFQVFAGGETSSIVSVGNVDRVISQNFLEPYIVAVGLSNTGSSFAIAMPGDRNRKLERTDFSSFLIDNDFQRLPNSKFLLLEWRGHLTQVPEKFKLEEPYTYKLFIETSLLPAEINDDLEK